jgi:tRNA (mo5U34)-methyltransferase
MDLSTVKERVWFYEFELPDGSLSRTDLPADVLQMHTSRRDKLRRVIGEYVENASTLTALDIASHEGYFSVELARHFQSVHGIDIRPESLAAAEKMTEALGVPNVHFTQADLTEMSFDQSFQADFVLVFGLLYHLENPVQAIRLASQLSKKHILIETQVFPFNMTGMLEDGHYLWQREIHGMFSLSVDYSDRREGGSTNICLVPSLNALLFLLREFGFQNLQVLKPDPDDYEQFLRGARVVIYGSK